MLQQETACQQQQIWRFQRIEFHSDIPRTGHTKVESSIPHVAKLTLVPETFKSAVNDSNNIETISARREVQRPYSLIVLNTQLLHH
jgi:hypothetical protein